VFRWEPGVVAARRKAEKALKHQDAGDLTERDCKVAARRKAEKALKRPLARRRGRRTRVAARRKAEKALKLTIFRDLVTGAFESRRGEKPRRH